MRSVAPAGAIGRKRRTRTSTALMPNARPRRRGQAPQPRSGAPTAQGLRAATRSAAQSGVPSCAVRLRQVAKIPPRDRTRGDFHDAKNLHQLDGVRSEKLTRTCE